MVLPIGGILMYALFYLVDGPLLKEEDVGVTKEELVRYFERNAIQREGEYHLSPNGIYYKELKED